MITYDRALFVLVGTAIGSSTASILFSLLFVRNIPVFRRMFATSSLHCLFNVFSGIIMIPLEILSGFLYTLTWTVIPATPGTNVVKVEHPLDTLSSLLLRVNETVWYANTVEYLLSDEDGIVKRECAHQQKCSFLFNINNSSDLAIGAISFSVLLALVCISVLLLVSLLRGLAYNDACFHLQVYLHNLSANSTSLPMFLAFAMGVFVTCALASVLPVVVLTMLLVATSFIPLHVAYAVIVGANVGSAVLLVFSALFSIVVKHALQIAVAFLLCNVICAIILLFVPFMMWPLYYAYRFANIVARYRWLAIVYILSLYFLLPILVYLLMVKVDVLPNLIIFLVLLLVVLLVVTYYLQHSSPDLLPNYLKNWNFLPSWWSLEKIDAICMYPCRQVWQSPKVSPTWVDQVTDIVPFVESKPGDSVSLVVERINEKYRKTNPMIQAAVRHTHNLFDFYPATAERGSRANAIITPMLHKTASVATVTQHARPAAPPRTNPSSHNIRTAPVISHMSRQPSATSIKSQPDAGNRGLAASSLTSSRISADTVLVDKMRPDHRGPEH